MDYYKTLGLNRNATKDEIKQAFRNIAKKFHPDKHSTSPKSIKDDATIRFKQASEAYEVLVDDHKRADYNLRSNGNNRSSGYGYTYDNRKKSGDYYYSNRSGNSPVSRAQIVMGYINSRAFLLHVVFAGYCFVSETVNLMFLGFLFRVEISCDEVMNDDDHFLDNEIV